MCAKEREIGEMVQLQGVDVAMVDEFKYLGSNVQSNGECGREVKKREHRQGGVGRVASQEGSEKREREALQFSSEIV